MGYQKKYIHDISKGGKQLSDVMQNYVQEKNCKREMILNYFGFKTPWPEEVVHSMSVVTFIKTCVIVMTV